MKKLLLLAVAMLTITVANSQTKEVEAVKKRLEKNDASIADAKKQSVAATWVERANIYIDIANVYTSKLIQGFDVNSIGAPISVNEVEYKGTKYNESVFANYTVYSNPTDNLIVFWTAKTDVVENPIPKAYDALVKAKELSAKDFVGSGRGVLAAGRLQAACQSEGMAYYNMDKAIDASKLFYKSFEAGELSGSFDTTYLYYAGITSFEGGQYAEALKFFDKVYQTGNDQEGLIYYYMGESYNKLGEVQKSIDILEKGFEKYPENSTVLGTLINVYLTSKQSPDKVIEKIKKAQSLDPKNSSLYLVESTIYNEIGDKEKAYATLDKAAEVDPNFFSAYYNYGIMKVLDAEALREQADKLDVNDSKGYEKLMNNIIDLQTKAIEKFEQAHKVDPKHSETVNLLKQLYFARRDNSPEEKAKYDYFENLYKTMEQ